MKHHWKTAGKKWIWALGAILCAALLLTPFLSASLHDDWKAFGASSEERDYQIQYKTYQKSGKAESVNIRYPVFSKMKNQRLQEEMNQQFASIYQDQVIGEIHRQEKREAGGEEMYIGQYVDCTVTDYNGVINVCFVESPAFGVGGESTQYLSFLYDINLGRRITAMDFLMEDPDLPARVKETVRQHPEMLDQCDVNESTLMRWIDGTFTEEGIDPRSWTGLAYRYEGGQFIVFPKQTWSSAGTGLEPLKPFGTAVRYQNKKITVMLDGEELEFDQQPLIENGRTLVPLRGIFEAMGAKVDWDQKTMTATAKKGDITVTMKIGESVAYRNQEVISLDVPGKVVSGRTLVPVRFIAEGFGASVAWNGDTKTVFITTGGSTEPSGSTGQDSSTITNAAPVMAKAYLDVIEAQCGTLTASGPVEDGMPVGLNYGTLLDFDGDGTAELYLVIGNEDAEIYGSNTCKEQVWGFDGTKAYLAGENVYDTSHGLTSEFCPLGKETYLYHMYNGNGGVSIIRIEKLDHGKLVDIVSAVQYPESTVNPDYVFPDDGSAEEPFVYKIEINGKDVVCTEEEYNKYLSPYPAEQNKVIILNSWGIRSLGIENPDPQGFLNRLKAAAAK